MRFDRFTIRGQEAVQEAITIAEKGQNQQVEPEHILAAMLEQKEGVVKPILGKIGATAQTITSEIEAAIQRETSMKRWYRAYKTRTIMARNPDWNDLYEELA